jgi:site-specific DNA recombinase
MNHVYAYIRVSTVKQGEKGSSLTEQRIAIEAYAKRQNIFIAEWFEERETAAKRGRTLFDRMLKQLGQGKASGVVIHKIDRGARNLRDWADIGALVDKGIEVHFAYESLDMKSRGGRLAADIQAVVAADFIRNLRDEVRKGFNGRLRQGLYPLPAPIGYLDQGRGLAKIPDPIMAPLIQQAFSLYATGRYSLVTLGDELYRLGLRNTRSGRVTRNGVSTLLNNEFYIGIIFIQRTSERFLGVHEPLIQKHLFDDVQAILRGRTNIPQTKNAFDYRKFVKCIHCSYNLIAERQKGHVYYRCHTRGCPRTCIREEVIDRHIENTLARLRMTPQELEELDMEFGHLERDRADTYDERLKAADLRIAAIDERRKRLTDAYIDRVIAKDAFEERNASLLRERIDACNQRDEIRQNPDSYRQRAQEFLELLKSLSIKAFDGNRVEKRDVAKKVTSNFLIDQKKLTAQYESPFDVVASYLKFMCGEPQRDRPRTTEAKIARLAKKISQSF